MANRGRPKKEDVRSKGYRIRMNDDELEMLEKLQQMHNASKAEVIRNALSEYYNKTTKNRKR